MSARARPAAFAQQLMSGDQHPRGTEAALQRVAHMKRVLNIGDDAALRQALHGFDVLAIRLDGKHEAGMNSSSIQQHKTRPARPHLAAEMRAGQAQIIPEEVGKRGPRFDESADSLAVYGGRDGNPAIHACALHCWC